MRALVVTNMYPTPTAPYAGPFVEAQVESLRAAGVDVDVLHFPRHELGRNVYLRLGRRVKQRVGASEPDLVHVAYGGVMADAVTRSIRDRPVLVTFHGTDLLGGSAYGVLNAVALRLNVLASHRAARRAAGVIVVSRTLLDALPRSLDRSRVWVVPNGVDLSRFYPRDRSECQRVLGWDPGRTHVLFPSSPSRAVKRFGLAQSSVALVNANGADVELHALDGVPYDDVPTWLNAASAILLTSAHEASPVIVKEALACNVPVVSVDVGDVGERIADIEGCFIAASTPEDLADKLSRSLERRQPIAGRERIEELSLERVAARVQRIYASLTNEGVDADRPRTFSVMPRLRARALMYHDVVAGDWTGSALAGAGPAHYRVTWESFLEHLDRIGEIAGAPPAVLDDLPVGGRASPWWLLTFDDGAASALRVGEELLRRRWRAYFFVTSGRIGRIGFLDADAIRALDRMGHVIGSHSVTHPDRMSGLAAEELLYEWQASVDALADVLGKQIRTGSVPGGYYRRRVAAAAARAGIATLFTSEPVRIPQQVGGCLVVGRYAVRHNTSASDAARAAAGSPVPWLRQYVGWNLRKPVKALAGESYERVRRARLAARSTPSARR